MWRRAVAKRRQAAEALACQHPSPFPPPSRCFARNAAFISPPFAVNVCVSELKHHLVNVVCLVLLDAVTVPRLLLSIFRLLQAKLM